MPQNKAAWLTELHGYPLKIDDAPMPEPGPHQLILKTKAVAMNPADAVVQFKGLIVTQFPSIIGDDIAGEVVEVGPEVTRFEVGDRVVALASELDMVNGKFMGSFQHYCKIDDDFAALIPGNVSYNEASVLPLALCTAVDGMFVPHTLNLPFPQISPKPTGEVLLIWGASSSVGSCAVQLARAAGYEVATTSSAHNMQYCRDLGASQVFDHRSENVEQEIVEGLKGKKSAGVFCCVIDDETLRKCASIASKIGGNKFVSTVSVPQMPHPDGLPEDVKMGFNYCSEIRDFPCGKAIWEDWLGSALASGQMVCKPDVELVGKGLEKIQDALDLMAKGVSAKKLVVEI